MVEDLNASALEGLLPLVSSWTGFHPDAIRADAVERVARTLVGADGPDRLLARAKERDPAVVAALAEGVTVGETYFFRQPEHFRHLAETVRARPPERRAVRAWSAGCATGEEAWSVAATLVAATGGADVEVIGTDLLERNVRAAERGEYGPWSFRDHSPPLHPVIDGPERRLRRGETVRVARGLRPHATFRVANVLEPQPEFAGRFDAIFCRNVLIYFSPDAARVAVANLAAALAPGGVLYLGPMDASVLPPGLVEIGPAGLNVYARAPGRPGTAAEPRRPPSTRPAPPRPLAPGIAGPAPVPAALAPPPPAPSAFEPIALHLRALTLLERGDLAGADALLEKVRSFAPDYLAGLLQLALLRDRAGRRGEAARIMRDLLARTAAMPRDERIPGPEELSAGYLLASARAYLGAEGGRT